MEYILVQTRMKKAYILALDQVKVRSGFRIDISDGAERALGRHRLQELVSWVRRWAQELRLVWLQLLYSHEL